MFNQLQLLFLNPIFFALITSYYDLIAYLYVAYSL